MKTEILQRNADVLRKTSQPVPLEDIMSKKVKGVIERMRKAVHAEEDGVAIAAPQIGEGLRIFLVNGEMFGSEDMVFINPEIIKASQKKKIMEEGCLSVRWLYGEVLRSEKITIKAYDEKGRVFTRGASGLLAQVFQHEIDHLNGILFTDKADNLRDLPPSPKQNVKFVYFGSSQFSKYVLDELEKAGLSPIKNVTDSKNPLPKLPEEADFFVVASFGKILPKEIIDMPKYGSINVHPSLLPELRGPSPIQNTILQNKTPGVTIIKMDEEMDHGPILAQEEVLIAPFPDHYEIIEEKLARAGGRLLAQVLKKKIKEIPQNHEQATYTKLIKKEDGLINLEDDSEINLRKVCAYSTWPGAYINFKKKNGEEIRVIIKDAVTIEGEFTPTRVIPAGKREMDYQDFLRGNQ